MATAPQDLSPQTPPFSVRAEVRGTIRTVAVRGELDLATADTFAARLATALGERPELVVADLSEVTFMDSTGVAVLVRARWQAERADVRFVVVASAPVQGVVDLCGLRDLLRVVPAR